MKSVRLRGAAGILLATALVTQPALALPLEGDGFTAQQTATETDVTEPAEAERVDRVDVSGLTFGPCEGAPEGLKIECATLDVPMDYDEPDGAKFPLDILRSPAEDQENKKGSIFVNPGGPGGSSAGMAAGIGRALSEDLRKHYDIVGVDPRGVGRSMKPNCFKDAAEQKKILDGMGDVFPENERAVARTIAYSRLAGKACGNHPKGLPSHMTTAQVARDMDVVRRAVGDEQLTYIGFSYGTLLGQMYANMFPDRVRAIVIDAVVDANAWTGAEGTGKLNFDSRLQSADGTDRAVKEILKRCDANVDMCVAAKKSDDEPTATEKYQQLMDRFEEGPLPDPRPAPGDGDKRPDFTRNSFADMLIGRLYGQRFAAELSAQIIRDAWDAHIAEGKTPEEQAAAADRLDRTEADILAQLDAVNVLEGDEPAPKPEPQPDPEPAPQPDPAPEPAPEPEQPRYDHGFDVFTSVVCGDGRHPQRITDNMRQALEAEKNNPFSGVWAFQAVLCAEDSWIARDEDRYLGPFNKKTSAPILVVGGEWDPATNIDQARKAAARQPNAELLVSDSWGHISHGTSKCASDAIHAYLEKLEVTPGLTCKGNYQPFTEQFPPPPPPNRPAPGQPGDGEVRVADLVTPLVPPSIQAKLGQE